MKIAKIEEEDICVIFESDKISCSSVTLLSAFSRRRTGQESIPTWCFINGQANLMDDMPEIKKLQ